MSDITPGGGMWREFNPSSSSGVQPGTHEVEAPEELGSPESIWFNPELRERDTTANLDSQIPATLYYLGRVIEVPGVAEVYIESLDNGRKKHWTVLSERDYDAMDSLYDIEEDTLDRFPIANLDFRVTVATKGGPTASVGATKIFELQQ